MPHRDLTVPNLSNEINVLPIARVDSKYCANCVLFIVIFIQHCHCSWECPLTHIIIINILFRVFDVFEQRFVTSTQCHKYRKLLSMRWARLSCHNDHRHCECVNCGRGSFYDSTYWLHTHGPFVTVKTLLLINTSPNYYLSRL